MGMVECALSDVRSCECLLSNRVGRQSMSSRVTLRFLCFIVLLPCLYLLGYSTESWAGPDAQEVVLSLADQAKQDKLWAEAQAFVKANDEGQAALYFKHFWKTYPTSSRANDALWQAAHLYKQQALQSENPDWSLVKDLFRAYIVDFPQSSRLADAYYEVGNSYFYMAFYREAQNYYSLLLKEYPSYSHKGEVIYMRARTYLQVGKFAQASAEFAVLQGNKDKMIRIRGEIGQADVHFFKGEWHGALGILKRIQRQNPDYYLVYPKILKDIGVASIRVGNVQEGRDYILHYLNIAEEALADEEAYFEVAESFLAEGVVDGARAFYEYVVGKTKSHDKYRLLSEFRLAQYGAVNLDKMSEKQRLAFFKKNGDRPFQKVLDRLYTDPLAQEARYSLFKRYLERQERELAYNLGKSYLRYKTTEKKQLFVVDGLGKILIAKFDKLLSAAKYEEIRSLYEKEFKVIAAYKKADLLMLIGRAYEQASLYDQASIIYYRALALEIEPEQKVKLYDRRAEVYLANNDLKSAQRLLKYLRRLYQNQPAIAEVNWLSGRLREAQMRPEDALEFYKMAVESGGQQEKKGVYGADYLRLLFALNDLSPVADLVAMFHEQQWLGPGQIQYWYGRLGQEFAKEGKGEAAVVIYKRALAKGLSATSSEAQPIHLHLGDLLMSQKYQKEALGHYRLAQAGPDKRITQLALARLNDYQIRGQMAEVGAML